MVGGAGAKRMAVERELKVVPFSARHMAGAAGASISGAPSLPRDALTSVLHMAGAAGATMMVAHVLPEEDLASAFAMVVASGAHTLRAPSPQKAIQVFASPMVEVVGASTPSAIRGPKEVQIIARHMEVGKGAPTWGVKRELRGAPRFAKDTAVVRGALSQVAAVKVCMVGPISVLPMEVASVVRLLSAPDLLGGGQIIVYDMGVGRDARLKVVGRVLREALIFARHMAGARDVHGVRLALGWVNRVHRAIGLQGVRLVFVPRTQPCWMIQGFMAATQSALWFRAVLLRPVQLVWLR